MAGLAIPASDIVGVTPSVLAAGGNGLDLIGVILTDNPRVPIGIPQQLASALEVADYFGDNSTEAMLGSTYFSGFLNSTTKPAGLIFSQYNTAAVGAYMRGGSLSSVSLTELQGFGTGTISITINGTPTTSGSINLAAATSFSNAAELITVGLGTTGPAGASFTGTIDNGSGSAGTVLTVASGLTGTIVVGQEVRGSAVTPGTVVSQQLTGTTGGIGTYRVTVSQQIASEAMTTNTPTCEWDALLSAFVFHSNTTGVASTMSVAGGTLATDLMLTAETGAIVSAGADPATPASAMNALVETTQNWACFMTTFDPDVSGNTNKMAFAEWVAGQNNRYVYMAWDTDITPTQSQNATNSLGRLVKTGNFSGTVPIFSLTQGPKVGSFFMGAIASIDFTEFNGRTTIAFRRSSGMLPDITSQTISQNLQANGYSFYGVWATANDTFTFAYPGGISGDFKWIDSYVNQIWMTNSFQLGFMVMQIANRSIPYNRPGYSIIKASMMDTVNQALDFGAIRTGVRLSEAQIAEVNSIAGVRVDDVIFRQGYYIQIRDATASVRAERKSPPIKFLYTDGGSVQAIQLSTVMIQ